MITKASTNKFIVKSESGKKMSKPLSKAGAEKRLGQIEFFKNKKK